MAYTAGDIITASDLNGFITVLDNVWGIGNATRGYGQAGTLSLVTPGSIINGDSWANMVPRITTLSRHQAGTPHTGIPLVSAFDTGELIEALTGGPNTNLAAAISAVDTNRLTAHEDSISTFAGVTSSRTADWGDVSKPYIMHIVTVNFTSANQARYFFNSGGVVELSLSRTGGASNPQNTEWSNLLTGMGNIRFSAVSTTRSGTVGQAYPIGYFGLTDSLMRIANASPEGYGEYDFDVEARTDTPGTINGSNGGTLTFKITLYNGGNDIVNGTLSSTVRFIKATTYLTISSPTVVTETPLTA